MRSIIYDAHLGQPVRDGEAERFALDLAEKNLDFTTATDNIISATRALIREGKIAPDSVEFGFGEFRQQANKDGRLEHWPPGFADYLNNWLGRLCKPKPKE